jgi:hypothetical protein
LAEAPVIRSRTVAKDDRMVRDEAPDEPTRKGAESRRRAA